MVSRPVFVAAQSGGIPEGQADPERENVLGARYLQHLYSDQKAIWTAPLKIRDNHLPWLIPFFSTTAGLMVLDSHVARQVPLDLSLRSRSHQLANLGTAFLVGSGAFLYLHGRFTHNEHSRETGLLASEAAIDSIATASALKLMSGRERPLQNFEGRFWQGGTSFPSEHAAIAWSVASVLAHEYPDARWQTALYGTAAAISISRVTSRDHFPSDILVGSALGYLIGRQVYRAHHNDDLPGSSTGTFEKEDSGPPSGSADVPLDSWIYPALDRLAALGLVKTNISGLRPWTRAECARLAQEAEASVESESAPPAVASLFQALDAEFSVETGGNEAIAESRIEEVYLRAGALSGQPLADDYHFAKTIVDDFGRPFGHGLNAILGVSSRSVAGPFAIYIRGEYEHAGTLPQLSNAALHAITAADATPFAVPLRAGSLDRFR